MQVKVSKFGGSSLADADHFKQVASIIKADTTRRYVIPSAPGKRFSSDNKVTDMLYSCYELASRGESIDDFFFNITTRYNLIIDGLGIADKCDLSKEYTRIKNSMINHAGRDYVASRGEYLNGLILASYLDFDFIDAANVIFFMNNSEFDAERTNIVLGEELKKHEYAVIPGFYGAMPNDTIKTFSRGGSDITGSIVARAAEADLYENWTDVSGILMADPRIVENPKKIEITTYKELRELSYMGFNVLHEDAIFPVRFAGIPINIKNTNKPEDSGTMIVSDTNVYDNKNIITGVSGKKGFSVITIEKDMMNTEIGFGRRVLEALEIHGISFEHLPSGIDTMSIVINATEIQGRRDQILNSICRAVNPESVYIEDGLALVAVVGRGMVKAKGTAAKVFKAAGDAGVNIRMIDQGSSELNIIVGVDESDFEKIMCAIYKEFISGTNNLK